MAADRHQRARDPIDNPQWPLIDLAQLENCENSRKGFRFSSLRWSFLNPFPVNHSQEFNAFCQSCIDELWHSYRGSQIKGTATGGNGGDRCLNGAESFALARFRLDRLSAQSYRRGFRTICRWPNEAHRGRHGGRESGIFLLCLS